jgi:hypothetical protein
VSKKKKASHDLGGRKASEPGGVLLRKFAGGLELGGGRWRGRIRAVLGAEHWRMEFARMRAWGRKGTVAPL